MAKNKMMKKVSISKQLISQTLSEIKSAGELQNERLVLWLGKNALDSSEVEEIYVPPQINESDYFRISSDGMNEILSYIQRNNLKIIAQVHSHPMLAFHSGADDKWAIVRHVGALSLVVPYFGTQSNEDTFIRDTMVFILSENNEWHPVSEEKIPTIYNITL